MHGITSLIRPHAKSDCAAVQQYQDSPQTGLKMDVTAVYTRISASPIIRHLTLFEGLQCAMMPHVLTHPYA